MHKIWAVMRREFLEKVRTRAFVIGTVLFPVLMVAPDGAADPARPA